MTERESPESSRTAQGFSGLLNGQMGLTGEFGGYLEIRATNFRVPADWPTYLLSALQELMTARAAAMLGDLSND